jgi:hypothetical protein
MKKYEPKLSDGKQDKTVKNNGRKVFSRKENSLVTLLPSFAIIFNIFSRFEEKRK